MELELAHIGVDPESGLVHIVDCTTAKNEMGQRDIYHFNNKTSQPPLALQLRPQNDRNSVLPNKRQTYNHGRRSETCSACGCPALASAADIEEAKTGVKQPPRLSRKQWQARRRAEITEIAELPFWKKPAAYALQAIRVVGAVFVLSGIFDWSLGTGLIGFAIILAAEILFSLLKGRPYDWQDS